MSVKWPEQISRFWFFLGLFLLPLIFWPWATIPYEIPRVWFANRWIEGLGFLGVLGILSGFKPPRRQIDTNLVLLTSFFVIWAIFSSLLGVDFSKSFWGNYYRSDGLLTLFHLAGLSFFLTLFWNHSWWQKTVTALASGATASGVWAIFSGCRQLPTGATFGQPNFLAGFLLICLPFSAFLLIRAKNKNEKIFWALAFTIQIAAILLTFSRAGILGILLFVLGWLFLHKKLPWIVGFLSLGLLLTASLLYLRQNPQQSSPEERLRIITKGIMAFEKRPIFGWGWANFDYAFESVSWPIKFQHDVYVDKAHSTILEILTATGLGGLAIYLTIVGRLAKQLWQKKSKVLFLTLLLFLFHSQTNVISIAEELIFWLILGIGSTEEPP